MIEDGNSGLPFSNLKSLAELLNNSKVQKKNPDFNLSRFIFQFKTISSF